MPRFVAHVLFVLPAACLARVDTPDDATSHASNSSSDAGPAATDGAASTDDVPGLWVDGEACTAIDTLAAGRTWPEWGMTISASCGALGPVRLIVSSRADIPYPQTCSTVTYVAAGFDAEGDAGTLYWEANASRGTCSVQNGPETSEPAAPILFVATLQDARDPSRARHIAYRAGP